MVSRKKFAQILKAVTGYMANIGYKSASIWHEYQPKEPPKPENMKKH